jgi:hypothetical protein
MRIKRSRSNSKADIWDVEIKTEEIFKFILAIQKSKNSDKNLQNRGINFDRRRIAKPNIWQEFQ